jgi:hypothetical protein
MVSRDAVRCSYAVFAVFVCIWYVPAQRLSALRILRTWSKSRAGWLRQNRNPISQAPELSPHPRFPTRRRFRRFRLLTQFGSSNSKLFLRGLLSQDDMTTVPLYPSMRSSSPSFSRERDQNVVSRSGGSGGSGRLARSHDKLKKKRVRLAALHADRANRRVRVTRPKRKKIFVPRPRLQRSTRLLMTMSAPAL